MQVCAAVAEVRAIRAQFPLAPWALVPTMGYLHDGHLQLVQRARAENERVAVSIFVNPLQFGDAADLDRYPRDLERDLELLRQAGVDLVWTPTPEVMYPPGFQTQIGVGSLAEPLEGGARPGHFRGVATVVAKLFNVVEPTRAYFGQKDFQQVAVLRQMVRDLNFPVEIVACPTVREADGLAMSSRNARLAPAARRQATSLHRALRAAVAAVERGERNAASLRHLMQRTLSAEPLIQIDYVSVADPETLLEQKRVASPVLLSLAAVVDGVRLIDNEVVGQHLVSDS